MKRMVDEVDRPIFELRQYRIFPGQLDRWVEWMDTTAIPFLESIGMTVVGSWSVSETNSYIWIRRFESESEQKRLTALQYENETGVKEMRPIINEMLDREAGLVITEMEASPVSAIR